MGQKTVRTQDGVHYPTPKFKENYTMIFRKQKPKKPKPKPQY
tara:strand:- start:361 stop:486 length:126 start_codon:yes stop_codon:yes gene_type:complete